MYNNWSLGADKPPRTEQIRIMKETQEALESDYTNIIWECGTGIGKSAMATTIAENNKDSYILTMTKQLQNQYHEDFKNILTEIKGRNAYQCNKLIDVQCDKGLCQTTKHKTKCKNCKYHNALNTAKTHPTVLTNYDYLYYSGNYTGNLTPRNLLILDEAHNLETKIMQLIGITLQRHKIRKEVGIDIFDRIIKGCKHKELEEPTYWINLSERLIEAYTEEKETQKNQNIDTPENITKINGMIQTLKNLKTILEDQDNKWIINIPTKKDIQNNQYGLKAEFKPLYIHEYSELLLQYGEHRLLMTGTLGDPDNFCKWNGLDQDDTYYIYSKSPFPKENRPIYKTYVGSMNYHEYNKNILDARLMIRKIIAKYPYQKGVIHTSSYKQVIELKTLDPRITTHTPENREEIIKQFTETDKPLILTSPSIKDGVDLKGDQCRFQILLKVPFPNLGDKQTNIKKRIDPQWYYHNTIMPLMQAYGRGVRSKEDYCDMYILDSDFQALHENNKRLFNEYFTEAIRTIPAQKGLDSIKILGGK